MLSLIKPLKKYDDYVHRAVLYDSFFLRRKAIALMKQAISLNFSNKELASGHVYLGLLSLKTKECAQAVRYFDKALAMIADEQVFYSSNFKTIIETFIKYSDRARARYWLEHSIGRQAFDKKFRRLEKYRAHL